MTKVKICGITREIEINIMNELMPDYVGFVFETRNRHFVSPQYAGNLRARLKSGIRSVGVFANSSLESIAMAIEIAGLDMVQLHGDETAEYIAALREYIRCPIIKVIKISQPIDADKAMYSTADFVMLDGGGAGHGKSFDWSLLGAVRRNYFLSGGLNPDNIVEALQVSSSPFGVNASSGLESNRVKDYRKVMKFITAVREYNKGKKR
ncbi:MAG: phosphoribosylanthranilate isomerase [Synergistaceae bacterium]|nr:phosphoribosylanthranilate isomerase [Synergistaceae bacterium]